MITLKKYIVEIGNIPYYTMWIKLWNWCDGFNTGITLLINRIEKGKSKR